MKKLFVAGIVAAAFCGASALAADMAVKAPPPAPVAATFSWTGFYLGGNAGAAWISDSQFLMTDPHGAFPFSPLSLSDHFSAAAMGGFHAGYNYQFAPAWVAGVEADWSWTGLKSSANSGTIAGVAGSNAFSSTNVNDIGSVRGRLGYAGIPNWLLYGTGGWAYAQVHDSGGWTCNALCPIPDTAAAHISKSATGWVAGAGAEYHLPPAGSGSWIVGVEYLYYGLNASASGFAVNAVGVGGCLAGSACNPVTFGNFSVQEVRARLSYKF
jgi:outer membrane immunogenic protein